MKVKTNFFVSSQEDVSDDNAASFTNWHHIMAVYNLSENGSGESTLYIDGVAPPGTGDNTGDDRNPSDRGSPANYSIVGGGSLVLGGDIDATNVSGVSTCNIRHLVSPFTALRFSCEQSLRPSPPLSPRRSPPLSSRDDPDQRKM